MKRLHFTSVAGLGAAMWTTAYISLISLGYLFAGNIPEISDLLASILMVSVGAMCTPWLVFAWRQFEVPESV